MSSFQIQLGWQVLLADPHEALDGDNRRIYNPQFVVAGQEGAEFAEQKGHDTSYLKGGGEPEQEQQWEGYHLSNVRISVRVLKKGAEIYSRWLVVVVVVGGAEFLFPIDARTMQMMIMTTIILILIIHKVSAVQLD